MNHDRHPRRSRKGSIPAKDSKRSRRGDYRTERGLMVRKHQTYHHGKHRSTCSSPPSIQRDQKLSTLPIQLSPETCLRSQGTVVQMGNIVLEPLGDLESDLRAQNDFHYIYDIYFHGSAPEQIVPINSSWIPTYHGQQHQSLARKSAWLEAGYRAHRISGKAYREL